MINPNDVQHLPTPQNESWHRSLRLPVRALARIGRHPLVTLVLPSIWFFWRYLPFWKDADVLNSLVWPFSTGNLLLCPPLYCIVARVPFWATNTLLHAPAPGVLPAQHPSLAAVSA